MNKIVREHYPVSSLPEDLRQDLDPETYVRIVIEELDTSPKRTRSLADMLADVRQLTPIGDDPVARIRKLRDEWED